MADELTTAEAAAQAETSRQYIAAEVQRGNIKARKVNPSAANSPMLIDRPSFTKWLAGKLQKKKRAQAPKA